MNYPRRAPTRWFTGAAAGLVALGPSSHALALPTAVAAPESIRRAALARFTRGFDNVLGTSLDLVLEAPRASDALAGEAAVLQEIERLRRILSTYDPASEIRRVIAGGDVESAELQAVLDAYAYWAMQTGGLISAHVDGAHTLNVDALGKAFVIDRAVAVARQFAGGGLLNLGGDLRAWGESAWPVALADPRAPAENAAPLARFWLREAAVATSGGYARNFALGGKRVSHLIDPRTLKPIAMDHSATIVAADCVTANALSTAASIAGLEAGAALAQKENAAGYVVVAGHRLSAGGVLAATAAAGPKEKPLPSPASPATPWPAGYQVTVPIELKMPNGSPREIHRPYVVVWIENEKEVVVRTLTLWGTDSRWQGKLTMWDYQARYRRKNDPLGVTRATRPAGAYTVTWDGLDDFKRPVPVGRYKFSLEICRERGQHVLEEAVVDCGAEPSTAAWKETAESRPVTLSYGPAKP